MSSISRTHDEQLVICFEYPDIPENFPEKILKQYNNDKKVGQKKEWFSYIDIVWEQYHLSKDPRWKSIQDFRKHMTKLCRKIQPPKVKGLQEIKEVYQGWQDFPIMLVKHRKPN